MAKRLHKKAQTETKEPVKEHFVLSDEKKQKIFGLLYIVAGLLILGSILSYSRQDIRFMHFTFGDMFGMGEVKTGQTNSPETGIIFPADSVQSLSHKEPTPDNWFGIWGAYAAFFFLEKTFGIFSIIFPFILFIWGYGYFFPLDSTKKFKFTSSLILTGLILSAFVGIIREKEWLFYEYTFLSGAAGSLLAKLLIKIVGSIGGLLLLMTALITISVYAFDLKIEKVLEQLKLKFEAWREAKAEEDTQEKTSATEVVPAVKKIKENKKTKTAERPAAIQDVEEEEETPKTSIRINRKEAEEREREKQKEAKKADKADKNAPAITTDAEGNDLNKIVIEEVKSEVLSLRQEEAEMPEPWEEQLNYHIPPLDLLAEIPPEDFRVAEEELRKNAEQLKEKLALFSIQIDDIEVTPGPVVTLYEIKPAPGVKISRIVSLENDIALALAARGIRIIAPIPGKSAIGVEIPNSEASMVVAKSVLLDIIKIKAELPMALGKTIAGDVYTTDLAKMPHLLVAGSTGSGKSVGINMMIASLLFSKHPANVKLAIIDPKKIELSFYQVLRQHFLAICPDIDEDIVTVPMNAIILLKSVELEMEHRYDMLAKAGVRNIIDYNIKIQDPAKTPKDTATIKHHFLPYIVVIIDELADLMITAGKEVEEPIARLAQLARAVGIHLIIATQRPSVNVITGVIKANFSTRIAYQVATKIDSRTILDMNGAEQLLGKGDMLFLPPGVAKPVRLQNAYISTEEVEKMTEFIRRQPGYSKPYYLPSVYDKKKGGGRLTSSDLDQLFEDAARVVVQHQQGSVSLLQRRLKLGYARAARIVDQLEEIGVVGPNDGSKARQVLVENEEQLETILRNL